jgi:hypothetical protein
MNIDLNNSKNIVLNTIFEWKGSGMEHEQLNPKMWISKCRLRIYQSKSMPNIVICSDLDEDDTGTSITNSCERVATLIWNKYKNSYLLPSSGHLGNQFIFIEHYPHKVRLGYRKQQESFTLVQFNWNVNKFTEPRWSPITSDAVLNLINQSTNVKQNT